MTISLLPQIIGGMTETQNPIASTLQILLKNQKSFLTETTRINTAIREILLPRETHSTKESWKFIMGMPI